MALYTPTSSTSTAGMSSAGYAALGNTHTKMLTVTHAITDDGYFSHKERYFIELTELALEKLGIPYEIRTVQLADHTESHSVSFLKSGMYDIYWLNTSPALENNKMNIKTPVTGK